MTNSGHGQFEWEGGQHVERVLSNGKRRFTPAFKAWVICQCQGPGVSLAGIALANGLNANLLRKWVAKRKPEVALPQLLPVRIEPVRPTAPQKREAGFIEVEIHGARVMLHGDVQAERLRTVLAALAALA
jgi:hypothetical protein